MSESSSAPEPPRNPRRFFGIAVFIFLSLTLFIGGGSALFYLLFSKYSGVRSIWLLVCGAPFVVVIVGFLTVFTLYSRFGRPLEQMFNAIDSVAEGDLSVRVAESDSPQFHELTIRFNKMLGELERAEQQRRNLTADIAHELRTPLHLIQGNLEGILDGVYQPTTEHINNTLEETRLLGLLVNDLQTLSLAETGQLPLHPTRFRLADLVEDVSTSFSARAAAQDIDLKSSVADPVQALTADYDRLDQVLSNLLSNALRHTPAGGIVSIRAEPIRGGRYAARITVRDTGSGIPAEDLPFIFDRFWRGDRSRSERAHSGLGLAIAKQLIHAHGGTITAESAVGEGSSFVIELPEGRTMEPRLRGANDTDDADGTDGR